MIQTIVLDTTIPRLIELGLIPQGLSWSKKLPKNYTTTLLRDGKRTILVCRDIHSSHMAYAIVSGDIFIPGEDSIFTAADNALLSGAYPELGVELNRIY